MAVVSPPPHLLLLCIDLQPVFLKALPDAGASLLRRSQFVVACATGLGLPVIFSEQMPQKLGPTAPELLEVAPKSARQLGKTTFSVFADDGIRETIKALDIEHILICGLETPICIYQSALEALDSQLQVTLFSDALGARRPDDAKTCLDALVRAGVHVLPSETVFYALLHDTRHPFFKTYTKLVKAHA